LDWDWAIGRDLDHCPHWAFSGLVGKIGSIPTLQAISPAKTYGALFTS
jgi:hypothetical protein